MSTNDFDQLLADTPRIRGLGYCALRSWGYTPDEAHQEALVALWELSKREHLPDNIGGYISRTLINAEISKQRGSERQFLHVDVDNAYYIAAQPEYSADAFMELIGSLTYEQQRVLFLTYFAGYKRVDLAEMYGIKVGTVKSRLNRLCSKLRNTDNV